MHVDTDGNITIEALSIPVCSERYSALHGWPYQIEQRGFEHSLTRDPFWQCMDDEIHFWGSFDVVSSDLVVLNETCEVVYDYVNDSYETKHVDGLFRWVFSADPIPD